MLELLQSALDLELKISGDSDNTSMVKLRVDDGGGGGVG